MLKKLTALSISLLTSVYSYGAIDCYPIVKPKLARNTGDVLCIEETSFGSTNLIFASRFNATDSIVPIDVINIKATQNTPLGFAGTPVYFPTLGASVEGSTIDSETGLPTLDFSVEFDSHLKKQAIFRIDGKKFDSGPSFRGLQDVGGVTGSADMKSIVEVVKPRGKSCSTAFKK